MASSKESLIILLKEVTQQTKFQITRPTMLLTPSELRVEYERRRLSQSLQTPINPQISADRLVALVRELHPLLKPYLYSKEQYVATGLMYIIAHNIEVTIEGFARHLVIATAMLGAERVVQLFFGWIEGESFDYQEKVLLSGVTIDALLELEEGIRINQLPLPVGDLLHMSPSILSFFPVWKFQGKVVLSVDGKMGPAFSKPVNDKTRVAVEFTWGHGRMSGRRVDSIFCEALSLACNHCIIHSVTWLDYGELISFSDCYTGSYVEYKVPPWPPTKPLTQGDLERAWDICLVRQAAEKSGLNLDIAIHRWIKSKWPDASFSDRLIDLRIALEYLLLKDNGGEKGFRLAVHGAWYLGCDSGERYQHFNTLRGVYSLASKAVHASDIKHSKEKQTLLADAQKLCCDIIVKMLREKHMPDWNKIIFGAQAV